MRGENIFVSKKIKDFVLRAVLVRRITIAICNHVRLSDTVAIVILSGGIHVRPSTHTGAVH